MNKLDLLVEFDRQLQNLIDKGYPQLTQLSEAVFRDTVNPLRRTLETLELPEVDLEQGKLPFVIVVKSDFVPAEQMMERVQKDGKNGVTILRPHTSTSFQVIGDVKIPDGNAYLLVDIDRGKESINMPPAEAMQHIKNANRSPLTIDEGIAIVTHYPQFLMKNNCFSLLASRTGSDQRVPAIWINGKKEPNLGWCWDGNPHTWLGSASGGRRLPLNFD